jgi:two-component system, OmpR family, response regulator
MLPRNLALIDNDAAYAQHLAAHLRGRGIDVSVFDDGGRLLSAPDAHGYDFYLVDPVGADSEGVELIRRLRRHSDAGLLVVSDRSGPEVFSDAVNAGADMVLSKPLPCEQVALAIQAVQRRAARDVATAKAWKLDRAARALLVPDGARVALSDADIVVLDCLLEAAGQPVTRETLCQRLGRHGDGDNDNGLNAIIYRLRRRIERATPMLVPLQSRSRVGYVFRAALSAA